MPICGTIFRRCVPRWRPNAVPLRSEKVGPPSFRSPFFPDDAAATATNTAPIAMFSQTPHHGHPLSRCHAALMWCPRNGTPPSSVRGDRMASIPQRNTKRSQRTAGIRSWIKDEHRIPTAKVAIPVRNMSSENFSAFHGEYDRPISLATVRDHGRRTSDNTMTVPMP